MSHALAKRVLQHIYCRSPSSPHQRGASYKTQADLQQGTCPPISTAVLPTCPTAPCPQFCSLPVLTCFLTAACINPAAASPVLRRAGLSMICANGSIQH